MDATKMLGHCRITYIKDTAQTILPTILGFLLQQATVEDGESPISTHPGQDAYYCDDVYEFAAEQAAFVAGILAERLEAHLDGVRIWAPEDWEKP